MSRRSGSRKNLTQSKFFCTQCGKVQFIARKQSLQRERGHLKKLYCPFCNISCNHYEVREYDLDFDYDLLMEKIKNNEFPLEGEEYYEDKN
jgi:ribosomal protein L33